MLAAKYFICGILTKCMFVRCQMQIAHLLDHGSSRRLRDRDTRCRGFAAAADKPLAPEPSSGALSAATCADDEPAACELVPAASAAAAAWCAWWS